MLSIQRRSPSRRFFTAASLILSFVQIPIFPAAPWLMYDPSGIACLIAALAFGPKLGAAVAIISWMPRVFLDPFGAPMGMLSTCAFVIPAAIMYAKGRTFAPRIRCWHGTRLRGVRCSLHAR